MYTCILCDLTNILGATCYMPAHVVGSGDRVAKNAEKVLLSDFYQQGNRCTAKSRELPKVT